MKFTLSYDAAKAITNAHRAYGWKFTQYLKMWKFYHSVYDGAELKT